MSAEVQSNQTIITSLLAQNTPVIFRAGGPSMTPTLRDGEPVQVRPLRPEDLRRGALLLYEKNGRTVLHRMVQFNRRSGTAWMTGDAALSGTEQIPQTAFIGIAQGVLRAGKTRRLDSPLARWLGLARFALRPLRKWALTQSHRWRTRPKATSSGT